MSEAEGRRGRGEWRALFVVWADFCWVIHHMLGPSLVFAFAVVTCSDFLYDMGAQFWRMGDRSH